MPERFKVDTLSTGYVNLDALLRNLREQEFRRRLHLALDQHEVDVFLCGSEAPSVWENNRSAGRESQGEPGIGDGYPFIDPTVGGFEYVN